MDPASPLSVLFIKHYPFVLEEQGAEASLHPQSGNRIISSFNLLQLWVIGQMSE
jgi:hypothetical protein